MPFDGIQLTGLWANKTKAGDTYYSGSLGRGKVLIFKNKNKRNEKDPDLQLFLAPKQEQAQQQAQAPQDDMPF